MGSSEWITVDCSQGCLVEAVAAHLRLGHVDRHVDADVEALYGRYRDVFTQGQMLADVLQKM
jgi:hypothetical protein